MSDMHIEVLLNIGDTVRVVQPKKGQRKRFYDSLNKLETEIRLELERRFPDTYIITPKWYTTKNERVSVRLSWGTESATEAKNLPSELDVAAISESIYSLCESVFNDVPRWLVTEPYQLETCGTCGDTIQPDQKYRMLTVILTTDSKGNQPTQDIFFHDGVCLRSVIKQLGDIIQPKENKID